METKETLEMRDEEAVRAAAPRAMRSMSPMAMLGRRGFLMGMGALGLAGITGCAPQATPSDSAPMAETGEAATAPASTEVTADTIKYEPIKTEMTLEELNERRQQLIDSKTEDYVCADGTVIPNVYVKLRSLLDTYGNGVGSQVHDGSYAEVMYLFTPEDAQAYLEMPMGVMFTAADYAAASGRAEDECAQICEDLSARGLLFRSRSNGTPEYHQLAEAHGIWEYNMNNYEKDDGAYPAIHNSQWGADIILQLYNARSSFYNAVPCSREVVADNEIALPYDDFEAIVDKFDKTPASAAFPTRLWAFPIRAITRWRPASRWARRRSTTSRTASAARSIRRRRWKSSIAASTAAWSFRWPTRRPRRLSAAAMATAAIFWAPT